MLIDLGLNHPFQSVVMPWITRAVPEATVSNPIALGRFRTDAGACCIQPTQGRIVVAVYGNAWADFDAHTRPLHTDAQIE